MSESERSPRPINDPPASGQTDEPREAPGADPALDRSKDDPADGPIGDRKPTDDKSFRLKPDERLSKDLEGLEVDEPDPSVEERLKGA